MATTWIAWEVAVNLTMQITDYSLKISALPDTPRYYLGGFLGGAVRRLPDLGRGSLLQLRAARAIGGGKRVRQPVPSSVSCCPGR